MEGSNTSLYQSQKHPSSLIGFVYKPCAICEDIRKSFACAKCMQQGQNGFLILQQGKLRRGDHHLLLSWAMQESIKEARPLIVAHNAKKWLVEGYTVKMRQAELESEIQRRSRNVERLKKLLRSRKLDVAKQGEHLSDCKKLMQASERKLYKLGQKKLKMIEYIEKKKKVVASNRSKAESLKVDLHRLRKELVIHLVTCIFPIKQFDPNNSDDMSAGDMQLDHDGASMQLQEQIDEARRMSFVCGRWVDQEGLNSDLARISVVVDEASAPADGNYGRYEAWLEGNHKQAGSDPPSSTVSSSMSSSDSFATRHQVAHNPMTSIGAALCHAAQLMHVLRKLLDVYVPHRVHYRTFCNPAVSPRVFVNSIKLLNSNILTLCLHQGVDGLTLHPAQTIRNLKVLTDHLQTEGLRSFPCLPSTDVLAYMEEILAMSDISDDELDKTNDESAMDWQSSLNDDWETVVASDVKSLNTSPPVTYTSTDGQSSMLTQPSGLVTSALAWAKGWWGGQGVE